MNSTSKPCPDQQTLLQFIQGRLEPPTLDHCEDHVSDCESCHETLRGFDTNDTLSRYVSEALQQKPLEKLSDTQAIDGIMRRLLQPAGLGRCSPMRNGSNAEILADRAAEVLRCVEPAAIGDEDSLGTLGDYRLLRLIGAGGTGVVFQARDESLDRIVALKVLRPSLGDLARDRFIAEARSAASIEHDNVVTIYQIGQHGRLAFIAMQWVPGETLETRLARESGALDETTVREFVSQIAAGLSAAHQRQLIHRDIKPANVWICDETGQIKILDFGLARIADEESSLTQTGMLAGTPSFMSPEQARGMELDPRSDLFSLGCVMYLMLTGRLPFSASTVLGTLQTIQSDSPSPPIAIRPGCDADLSDLTMSLLEKLPGNRMASADNLISSLNNPRSQWPQKVVTAPAATSSKSPATPRTNPAARRSRSGFRWLIATSLLGFAGVAAWLMAPQIFRFVTDQGELVIKTDDPNIKIEVRENGDLFRVLDLSTDESFDIQSGSYTFSATKQGSDTEFEVTPNSVKMTRGGKELVSVKIQKTPQDLAARFPKIAKEPMVRIPRPTDSKDLESILSTALMFQNNKLNRLRDQYRDSHPEVVQARKQLSIISEQYHAVAHSEASAPKVASDPLSKKITSTDTQFSAAAAGSDPPIYGGRDFRQWLRIVKKDREPQTVSDAIAACGVLAETDRQKDLLEGQLRRLVRKFGTSSGQEVTNGGAVNTANIYNTGFLKALNQLEIDDVISFIQGEMDSGNERSLGFCYTIFPYLDFDDDRKKALKFHETVTLDTNLLMKRIHDQDIEIDADVKSFLSQCFAKSKTIADPAICQKAIMNLDAAERPWLFSAIMVRFKNGELNEAIEADFFAESTSGKVRESYINAVLSPNLLKNGGGGIWPRGFRSQNKRTLAIRLLAKAITQIAKSGESNLEFNTYKSIWFREDKVVITQRNENGTIFWSKGDGSGTLVEMKPEGIKQVKGRAAVIRHLLTDLCDVTSCGFMEDDRKLVLEFVNAMKRSEDQEMKDLFGSAEFKELMIESDLNNLRDFANGDANAVFTSFTKEPNSHFGGGGLGGRGVF